MEDGERLGTAGALGRLRPWIDGRPVLVLNADTWTTADLGPFVAGWDGVRPRLLCVADPELATWGDLAYAGAALLPVVAGRATSPTRRPACGRSRGATSCPASTSTSS